VTEYPFPVDATNADQVRDWDGGDGAHWAQYHTEYERLLGVFDLALLAAGQVRADDRCLDIGCGTGATTRALAARAAQGSVLGLDVSGPMLEIARQAAHRETVSNVEFVQGDAQVHPFATGCFDLVVSRMGCMFFGDPEAAFANIGRALRRGGRLALTVWQEPSANGWINAIDDAIDVATEGEALHEAEGQTDAYAPSPFSLADPAFVSSLLERAGFVDVTLEGLEIPLAFGTVLEAQNFVETWIDDDLDDHGRAQAKESLQRLLVDNDSAEGVRLHSATWLITARR
jgi:ubiquinone/menaquinone biosynthesis C-methylase UbiE